MNEGRNEHHYEIFRRNEGRMKEGRNEHIMKHLEGRMKEGRNEHPYEIFRRKEGRMKEGISIIMKYLEGRKEE